MPSSACGGLTGADGVDRATSRSRPSSGR